jgi:hypothetical protein
MPSFPARPLANLLCSVAQLPGRDQQLLHGAIVRLAQVSGDLPLLHLKRATHALAVLHPRTPAAAPSRDASPAPAGDAVALAAASNAPALAALYDALARQGAAKLEERPAPGRLLQAQQRDVGLMEGLARAFALSGCTAAQQPGVRLVFAGLAVRLQELLHAPTAGSGGGGGVAAGLPVLVRPEVASSLAASFAAVGLEAPPSLAPFQLRLQPPPAAATTAQA